MNLIITGAAGFIGSNFCCQFYNRLFKLFRTQKNILDVNFIDLYNQHNIDTIKHIGKGEITHIRDRPFNDYRYRVNSTKLQKLGWKIKTNFDDELVKIIEWHKQNPNYWD